MKVEHENFFFAIFSSVHLRRRWFGTNFVIAWAKSALMTSASARCSPLCVRTPTARRPSNSTSFTSSFSVMRTPSSRATRAIPSDTAEHPPIGCHTPYSYSRNDRIENRLGQLNGDMPRYFDWNENASRTRSSRKYRPSSASSDFHGLSVGNSFMSCHRTRSRQPWNGRSRHGRNFSILTRLSARKRRTFGASAGLIFATSASNFARSGVQFSWPPLPNAMRYCGSSRTIGTSACRSRPIRLKMRSSTRG